MYKDSIQRTEVRKAKLEDRYEEIIYNSVKRDKQSEYMRVNLGQKEDRIKKSNILIRGIPYGENRENKREMIVKEIIVENLKLMKDTNPQIEAFVPAKSNSHIEKLW